MSTQLLPSARRFLACVLAVLAGPLAARAQGTLASVIPLDAPNCRVSAPPERAGIAPTPGGFVMVFPRNDALGDAYTGCKVLWVVDTDRTPRLATLYFEKGRLARAVAHDVRDDGGAPEGACAFPEGKSLMPEAGRRFTDEACRGATGEELYGLRVPTWPRSCLANPDAAVCRRDPTEATNTVDRAGRVGRARLTRRRATARAAAPAPPGSRA